MYSKTQPFTAYSTFDIGCDEYNAAPCWAAGRPEVDHLCMYKHTYVTHYY